MRLSQNILEDLPQSSLEVSHNQNLPEKVLQFGTGNFLRGYADWMIDKMNSAGHFQGRIVVVQSSMSDSANKLNQQNGLYTTIEKDQTTEIGRLITSLSRVLIAQQQWSEIERVAQSSDLSLILSNTTEAGIVYEQENLIPRPSSKKLSAKLTALLHARFKVLGQQGGLVICPMELIENNGSALLNCVLRHARDWDLDEGFKKFITEDCEFCSTLVDRIVSGYPKESASEYEKTWGYEDSNMVMMEPYHLLVIKNGKRFKELLPLNKLRFNVTHTDDLSVHRDAKVRFLNGAHTSSVLAAYLYGCNTVMDMMEEKTTKAFLNHVVFEEILPGVSLPPEDRLAYAKSVLERFANPTLQHQLLAISLNSLSKWIVRVLPSIKSYQQQYQKIPKGLCFSLAALLYFYRGTSEIDHGMRAEESYPIKDDSNKLKLLSTFTTESTIDDLKVILSSELLWGENLHTIQDLTQTVFQQWEGMLEMGFKNQLK